MELSPDPWDRPFPRRHPWSDEEEALPFEPYREWTPDKEEEDSEFFPFEED